jgi:DNA (cytosine-5)-methyltransferase 1
MKSVELFTGAGGLALGLSKAGFDPDLMVEWDEPAARTIAANKTRKVEPVLHWPFINSDVREIEFRRFEGIDLVAGGPPCQPFSIGGKHRGASDTRDMWPEAIRAVREVRPKAFLFENVRGLLRESFRDYLSWIELSLKWPEIVRESGMSFAAHLAKLRKHEKAPGRTALRYVVSIKPVDAADYGAAQNRRRVIIVGIRADLAEHYSFPLPTHSRAALILDQSAKGGYWNRHKVPRLERSVSEPEQLELVETRPWVTVRDALAGLPDPRRGHTNIPNHVFQPGARSYVGHTGSPLDAPAKALKAGDHGVPGGENMLRYHNGQVRYFTVREAARLQGFPDEFIFPPEVAWSESMRQLGNAVPVSLAFAVANSVAAALRAAKNPKPRARAA